MDQKEQTLKKEEIVYESPPLKKRDIELESLYGDNPFNSKSRIQSTKVIPQFSLNSEQIIKQAVTQNRRKQKRERSGSFYFESNITNQEKQEEEKESSTVNVSKTPNLTKGKDGRKLFSFDIFKGRRR